MSLNCVSMICSDATDCVGIQNRLLYSAEHSISNTFAFPKNAALCSSVSARGPRIPGRRFPVSESRFGGPETHRAEPVAATGLTLTRITLISSLARSRCQWFHFLLGCRRRRLSVDPPTKGAVRRLNKCAGICILTRLYRIWEKKRRALRQKAAEFSAPSFVKMSISEKWLNFISFSLH